MEDAGGKERESGRGRAKGGMVLGIRNEIRDEEECRRKGKGGDHDRECKVWEGNME